MKWPVIFIGIVLVAAVLIFALAYGTPSTSSTAVSTSTIATSTEIIPGMQSAVYRNADYGFTIEYPSSTTPETTGFDGFLPVTQRPIVGLRLSSALFQGTNLVEAGVFIGASADMQVVNNCLSPASDQEQALGTKTIGSTVFRVFSSTGAGAGNLYEENSFRTVRNGTCFELVELLHSGNIGNYPAGKVRPFDESALRRILDSMVDTFSFTANAGSGVEGKVNIICATDTSDPACASQVQTVEAYQGVSAVALFKTQADGSFHESLPPGQYELRVETASSTHCVSVGVVVTDGSYVSTDISCEAGVQE